jgi:hypothetical protein
MALAPSETKMVVDEKTHRALSSFGSWLLALGRSLQYRYGE